MNATIDDRDWFRGNVIGHALGLLEDDDEDRFERLLGESEECRDLWEEFSRGGSEAGSSPGHLPAGLVARWPRAQLRLRGLERDLVEKHLRACQSCQAELRMLGYEPTLEMAPPGERTRREAEPARSGGSRFDLRTILVGAMSGAVAAAVTAALILSGPDRFSGSPGALPWVAPTALRGEDVPTLATTTGQPAISLMVEVPLDFDLQKPAELVVEGPDGGELLRQSIDAARVGAELVVVVLRRGDGWNAGRHTVRLTQSGGSRPLQSESVFQLELD